MRIFNEEKTIEMIVSDVDLLKGYVDRDILTREENGQTIEEKIQVYILYTEEEYKDRLRYERQVKCYEFINRGEMYWNKVWAQFPVEQVALKKLELQTWYETWLNVTSTKVVPIAINWLL